MDPAVLRNEYEAKRALAAAGIAVPQEAVVHSADEAVRAAEAIGYPVVLKIVSEDIPHKTEAGGVALDLRSAAAVRDATERLPPASPAMRRRPVCKACWSHRW